MRKKKKAAAAPEQGTEERIRLAALKEFAEKGLSGARVDSIAREADVNIRMIYYFFGSKEGLLEAVLSEIFQQRQAQLAMTYDNVADLLASYFDGYSEDSQRVRLLQWEALQTQLPAGASKLTNFADRQDVVRRRIASIVELQRRGVIPGDFDPKFVYLMFVALTIYPMAFPQSVFIATGDDTSGDDFKKRYRGFLRQLGNTLFAATTGRTRKAGREPKAAGKRAARR